MGDNEQKNRPEDSDFKQQRLRAWQPILTPGWVIFTFFTVGIVFLAIGIAVLEASDDVVEFVSEPYQSLPAGGANCKAGPNSTSTSCLVPVTIPITKKMAQPIYVYYQLNNFYQNHRRYVKSRSDVQLRNGDIYDVSSSCEPLATRSCGTNNAETCAVYPCGLIAWSVFNDTFYSNPGMKTDTVTVLRKTNNVESTVNIAWTSDGIAWQSDKEKKFITTTLPTPSGMVSETCTDTNCIAMPYDSYKYFLCADEAFSAANGNLNSCPMNKRYADVNNEEFIVWMRTSGLPDFRKLHRIIKTDLEAGDTVSLMVNNVFPVTAFSGEKRIVLSTTTWIGGKNQFLGWAYIVVAILCILLAIGFLIKQAIAPREPTTSGDLEKTLNQQES